MDHCQLRSLSLGLILNLSKVGSTVPYHLEGVGEAELGGNGSSGEASPACAHLR